MIRPLVVLVVALLVGAWTVIDLSIHAGTSAIRRGARAIPAVWRRWQDRRYLKHWGLESYDEDAQEYVKARLRCDAVLLSDVTDEQWQEFVEAHSEKTEEAS